MVEALKIPMDFIVSDKINSVWLTMILWLFWPGVMFVVGLIFESRLIPVGKRQSKAFLPGDLSLPVMVVALLNLHDNTYTDESWWGYSLEFSLGVILAMFFVASKVRKGDVANYPTRSGISPTKVTHDLVGYFLIPSLLIILGIPKILAHIFDGVPFMDYWRCWAIFVAALLFYIICVMYDAKHPFTKEDVLARHPEDWRPLWK